MQHFRTNPPSRSIPPRPEVQPRHREVHAMILRHCARHGMTESAFGRRAVSDPAFVSRMRGDDYEMTDWVERRIRSFLSREVASA